MSVAAKQDFLDRLKASISCLPLQDQADILNDYEEHFRIGLENGKTEAEIAGSLGSPEELGASFVEGKRPARPGAGGNLLPLSDSPGAGFSAGGRPSKLPGPLAGTGRGGAAGASAVPGRTGGAGFRILSGRSARADASSIL